MRPEFRQRWSAEAERCGSDLKTPKDLLARRISDEDYIDTAVIGGVSVADILSGKVTDAQIPQDVQAAFHLQYPNQPGFVDMVREHADNSRAIVGIVSGVKGKLFEINYAGWLNDGHLLAGYSAHLAPSATQPGWDIQIQDAHGQIADELQLKATETVAYVRDAIAAHPDIPIVVPHDAFDALAGHTDIASHLIDGSPQSLDALTNHVSDAADSIHAGIDYFHIPEIAIAWAVLQNYSAYRQQRVSLEDALRNVGSRSVLATIASGAGWAAAAAAHSTIVGIPVAMVARLFGAQFMHNRGRRNTLERLIVNVQASQARLREHLERPVVTLALPS